jgi:uncharacterized membrane protein HdeD (DUF308 family)
MNSNNLKSFASLLMISSIAISFIAGIGFGLSVIDGREWLLYLLLLLIPILGVASIALSFKAGQKYGQDKTVIYIDPHADSGSQKAVIAETSN